MSEFAAALLAGGHSRRMGTDKAFLPWQGRPLWEHQLDKLRSLAPTRLLLSCRAGQPFVLPAEVTPVRDAWPECGPLGGVASCMRACDAPLLLVLGIDLPLLPAEFLRDLLTEVTASCGVVVRVQQFFEPLAAIYPRALRSLAGEHLAAGRFAMQDFIRTGIARDYLRCVDLPVEARWFTNWNAPGDLPANNSSVAV